MRRQSCKGSDADVTGNCVHFSCVACASDDWIFFFSPERVVRDSI